MFYMILLLVFLVVLFTAIWIRNLREEKAKALRRKLGLSTQDNYIYDTDVTQKPKVVDSLEKTMIRAGIVVPVYRFLAYSAIVFGAFFTLGLLYSRSVFMALFFGIVAIGAVWVILKRQGAKRKERFENQLESIIVMIAGALRSGASLAQSIDYVSKEVDEPAAFEFKMMAREVEMGVPASEALFRASERLGGEDLHILATAAVVQSKSGGNLPEILDNLATTIRDRKALRSSLKALTAEGRMSGTIVGLIPFVVSGAILVISPGYFAPMWGNPLGRVALIIAFAVIFLGWFIIRRISNALHY